MLHINLLKILADQDMTMSELATRTGMSKTTLTSLTNNTGKGIQFDTLNRLCMELNVTPSDFFEYVDYDFDIAYGYLDDSENGDYIEVVVTHGNRTSHFPFAIYIWYKDMVNDYFEDNTVYLDTDVVITVALEDIFDSNLFKEKYFDNLPLVFKRKLIKNIKNIIIDEFNNKQNEDFGIAPKSSYGTNEIYKDNKKSINYFRNEANNLNVTFDIIGTLEYGKIKNGKLV